MVSVCAFWCVRIVRAALCRSLLDRTVVHLKRPVFIFLEGVSAWGLSLVCERKT